MRPKREFRSASVSNYEYFLQKNPSVKISYYQFKKIIYTWNNLFCKHVIETGEKVKIPYGIGPITITKYKPTKFVDKDGKEKVNLAIDWPNTKKEGKYIYHLNYHTDGFKFYWAWFPHESYIKMSHIWKFEIARVYSRTLGKLLKNPNDNHKDNYKQWVIKK